MTEVKDLSLADLSLDFLELFPDVLEEVLKILFFAIKLLQLTLDPAVLALVMSQMPFPTSQWSYSS